MQNFILYTRCSTDEQTKRGNSHEYQTSGIRSSAVVKAGKLNEVALFSDTVTGTRFDNRTNGLDQAYKVCEKNRGAVSFIFVYRWDRLGRDVADCFDCIKKFRAVGVEVNCPDEYIDFSDPSYPLILSVKFGMAQSESMRISDRTRDGVYQAQVSGFYTAKAPIGYTKGKAVQFNGKERKLCEIDSEKAPIVKACFDGYALGLTKAELMSKHLKALGIQKSQFARMFHNPFYTGKLLVKAHRANAAQLVEGHHPAIISQDLFEQCQQVQETSEHPTKGKTWVQSKAKLNDFWLKGVLQCPITGRNMTAYNSKGKSGAYFPYYSSQKIKGGLIIPAGQAHALAAKALSGFKIDSDLHAEIKTELNTQLSRRIEAAKSDLSKAMARREKTLTRLEAIKEQFADSHLTAKEYREFKATFDADLVSVDQRIEVLEAQMVENDDTVLKCLSLLTGIDTVFAGSSPVYKNRILKAVFPDGIFIDKKAGKVRTPCVNEIMLSMCSKSIICDVLEIEKGQTFDSSPLLGGWPDRYRTHFNALKLLFAA